MDETSSRRVFAECDTAASPVQARSGRVRPGQIRAGQVRPRAQGPLVPVVLVQGFALFGGPAESCSRQGRASA